MRTLYDETIPPIPEQLPLGRIEENGSPVRTGDYLDQGDVEHFAHYVHERDPEVFTRLTQPFRNEQDVVW